MRYTVITPIVNWTRREHYFKSMVHQNQKNLASIFQLPHFGFCRTNRLFLYHFCFSFSHFASWLFGFGSRFGATDNQQWIFCVAPPFFTGFLERDFFGASWKTKRTPSFDNRRYRFMGGIPRVCFPDSGHEFSKRNTGKTKLFFPAGKGFALHLWFGCHGVFGVIAYGFGANPFCLPCYPLSFFSGNSFVFISVAGFVFSFLTHLFVFAVVPLASPPPFPMEKRMAGCRFLHGGVGIVLMALLVISCQRKGLYLRQFGLNGIYYVVVICRYLHYINRCPNQLLFGS